MVSPLRVALRKCCPRCGEGALYQSFLKVTPRCDHCDLNLENADSGDGPAVFIILILGGIVVAQMMLLEVLYAPPLWLHNYDRGVLRRRISDVDVFQRSHGGIAIPHALWRL